MKGQNTKYKKQQLRTIKYINKELIDLEFNYLIFFYKNK